MIYQEIRCKSIPSLDFMKNSDYVLYVGPKLSWFKYRKFKSKDVKVPVIYLHEWFGKLSKKAFAYNFPGIPWPHMMNPEALYADIRSELDITWKKNNYIFISYDEDGLVVFDAKENFSLAVSYLQSKRKRSTWTTRKPDVQIVKPDVQIVKPEVEVHESGHDNRNSEEGGGIRFSVCEDEGKNVDWERELNRIFDVKPPVPKVEADKVFDKHMSLAADEVRQSIRNILLDGFPIEIILSWLKEEVRLSRLRITRQFKILLVDYDMEIELRPLPKTVFLFYLRHPEGVPFSHLQDHVQELMHIYEHVSVNDDLQKMKRSIRALVDPFNNSICEKCAAVKSAFMKKVRDEVAENYYITGAQGQPKCITLDRNLVEWECELSL